MNRALAGACFAALLIARPAIGSTRAFTETYETRTGAEGDAQIETWVDDNSAFGNWDVWRIWWGGTASITDAIEVSIYGIAAQQSEGSASAGQASTGLQLEMIYFMGRYRFIGTGGEGFSAMFQLQYCLPTLPTPTAQVTYDYLDHSNSLGERLIASYQHGRFFVSANLLFDENFLLNTAGGVDFLFTGKYAAGAAFSILQPGPRGPPLTIGFEVFGDLPFARGTAGSEWWPGGFPFAIGPAASAAFGRFWATASWGYAPGGGYSEGTGTYYGATAPTYTSKEAIGRIIAAFEF